MDEEKRILEAINSIALPEDVKTVGLKFSPDSSGMPAVWVNLHIDDADDPSDARIGRLSEARRAISDKLLAMERDNWPYVRLVAD
ncbi:hypothetical protein INH39_20285 [Massilia violaceinigra]|uniref:Uncharacterized protein n=1 Tax=Massilia violaceinigra TaxID=2045208 RepID=A0ABY3ZZB6_9BURK|nr:hypothetical protein [Massilia violaceinigra]UOD27820.1 hypothetical protein INH39_20285 [Massilia violaceinigra]